MPRYTGTGTDTGAIDLARRMMTIRAGGNIVCTKYIELEQMAHRTGYKYIDLNGRPVAPSLFEEYSLFHDIYIIKHIRPYIYTLTLSAHIVHVHNTR